MSKESSSSKMPSNEDLEKFTKIELIAFLKSRGVDHTGNRKQLVSQIFSFTQLRDTILNEFSMIISLQGTWYSKQLMDFVHL